MIFWPAEAAHVDPFYTLVYIDLYVQIDVWKKMTKSRKQPPPQGDDASTV